VAVDNRAEWIKMVQTLIKYYDPLRDADFAYIIIDIFYTFLSLETYCSLLPQPLTVGIVEEFLESLFLINN
jgi:hypothetical protein